MPHERLEQASHAAQQLAPCGLMSFDDDGRVVFANEQFHQWLQASPGELIGWPVEKLLTRSAWVFHNTHFFPLLKLHGQADEIYLTLRSQSGSELPVLVSAAREPRASGALNHCAMMTIRRRNEFEAALVEARKGAEAATQAKDQFLAVVSHELRTPLNAILGWVRLMRNGKLDAAMQQRALDTLERNAQAQALLIEDLLDISRIVSGKMRLSPRAIDLLATIEAAVDTARPAAYAKDIQIQLALDSAAGIVYADAARMQQVVWNLVSNAIKFTPRGGRVQVTLTRVDSKLRLEVSDNGAGLPPAQLPYLFERFWQAEPLRQQEKGGLGLGLAICKNLIELHGGTIRASSPGIGQGATFTVELPLAIAACSDSASSTGAVGFADESLSGLSLEGLRLLVVDDDKDAREILKMLLQGAGAEVSIAGSCEDALQALRSQVPDILLSDVGMPGKDGYELIRSVRSGAVPAAASIPAVAITGLARPHDRVSLLRAGFQAHLSKPVEPSEVLALVAALVSRRAS